MIGNDIALVIKDIPTALRLANKLIKKRFMTRMPAIAQQKLIPIQEKHKEYCDKIIGLQATFNQKASSFTGDEIPQILPPAEHRDIDSMAGLLKSIYLSHLQPTVTTSHTQTCTSLIAPFATRLPIFEPKKASTEQLLINQQQRVILQEMITTSLIYETNTNKGIQYYLYMFPCEANDDDVLIPAELDDFQAQKQIINYLKQRLEEYYLLSIAESRAVGRLLYNIGCSGIFTYLERGSENLSLDNFNWLMTWFKFASHILSEISEIYSEENINIEHFTQLYEKICETHGHNTDIEAHCVRLKSYSFYTMMESIQILNGHTNFIKYYLQTAKSDIDYAYIEQSLDMIKVLLRKISKLYIVSTTASAMDHVAYKLSVHEADLAYRMGRMADMCDTLDKLKDNQHNHVTHIQLLVLSVKHFMNIDIKKSKQYFDQADARFQIYLQNEKNLNIVQVAQLRADLATLNVELLKIRCDALSLDFNEKSRKPFMQDLKRQFPEAKVKLHPERGVLIYCPLDAIPYNIIKRIRESKQAHVKILDVFDQTPRGDKVFTGLHLLTVSYNSFEIVQIIKHWLSLIHHANEKNIEISRLSHQEIQEQKPEPEPKVSSKLSGGKVMLIQQPESPYQKPALASKEKTHKASAPATTPIPIPAAIARAECHAADFGFTLPGNPLVTPVYCSEAAQRQRRAKLFVMFKGIRGVEESVEKQFAEMLNPQPEGLLTVGMVNQAGVKLWRHPDALGDAWNLCALRFKRKGAAGWLRAIAEPVAKVTVTNSEGKQENHYLFSLGKPKHK